LLALSAAAAAPLTLRPGAAGSRTALVPPSFAELNAVLVDAQLGGCSLPCLDRGIVQVATLRQLDDAGLQVNTSLVCPCKGAFFNSS
jgi:hypothetical protein